MKENIKVRIAKCSDWEVLYVDGIRKYEGHTITLDLALFDFINGAIHEKGNIASIDFGILYVKDRYMQDTGCPLLFEDIPDNAIAEMGW